MVLLRSAKQGTTLRGVLLAVLLGAAVSGCSIFEGSKAPPLPGERIPVLDSERILKPDDSIGTEEVRLPHPFVNPDWPQSGGYPSFAMQHLQLGDNPHVIWRQDVGEGSSSETALLAPPVVAEGKVFLKDATTTVSAFDANTGKLAWRVDVRRPKSRDREGFGGGVAYYGGRLFVSTGGAQVIALDPRSGKEIWRSDVSAPVRGAPTVFADRVFVVSIDNQTHALNAVDGTSLWDHSGLTENAGLLGGTSPAASGDYLIAPYSSGELVALRIDSGRSLWTENLVAARRTDTASTLTDIGGRPVIDRGRVFAIGSAGLMVAVDLRSGNRIWEKQIAGTQTPWVAGEWLYVLTSDSEVVCLNRNDGRIRWVTGLPQYANPKKKSDPYRWAGPVLAGDRLLVAGSTGQMMTLSPYTGEILGALDMRQPLLMAPIVANGTVYLLTDDAQLIALR
jgi:outer membrane protein assembly factor BamB